MGCQLFRAGKEERGNSPFSISLWRVKVQWTVAREEEPDMADYEIFELKEVVLQCGLTLRQAQLVYKTYGELNAARDNVIVMPTFYGGQLAENEVMIAAWHALD